MKDDVANRAAALARMWITSEASGRVGPAGKRLASLLARPGETDVALTLATRAYGAETTRAAAGAVRELAGDDRPLGKTTRALLRAGENFAAYAPALVSALARWRVRSLLGPLVVDGATPALRRHIASTLPRGERVDVHPVLAPVHGEAGTRAYIARVIGLLARPDVDYVTISPAALAPSQAPWDTAGATERIAERLGGIFTAAMAHTPHKFIHLDAWDHAHLAVNLEAFQHALSRPELMHFSAGLTLDAALPDANEALARLTDFALRRVGAGGSPLKVRIVAGGARGDRDSEVIPHRWVPASYDSAIEVEGNLLRLVGRALRPETAYALRTGVSSDNPFHIAYAHILSQDRGVQAALDVEMYHARAPGNIEQMRRELANPIILAVPVVDDGDLGAAVPYLAVHRPSSQVPAPAHRATGEQIHRLEEAFLAAGAHEPPAQPRRSHRRPPPAEDFATTPPSDPSIARTREAMVEALRNEPPPLAAPVLGAGGVEDLVEQTRGAAGVWAGRPWQVRREALRTIASELEDRRGALIGAMVHEVGMTLTEADDEVSEAIDHALYCAQESTRLDQGFTREGIDFLPDALTVVAASGVEPLSSAVSGAAAALAAGSALILKPSCHAHRTTAVAIEAIHAGLAHLGEPGDHAQVAYTGDRETARALIAHPEVDTVILTGRQRTARLFTSWRLGRARGPRIFGSLTTKNTATITPSADYDHAVACLVDSAFHRSGQGSAATRLLILVGEAGTSPRLRDRIVDAVSSITVDWPTNPAAQVGPVTEPLQEAERRALLELADGEHWWVEPHALDDSGRLWRPGIKAGVRPGSDSHHADTRIPALEVMTADSLPEALRWAGEFAGAAALHSLSSTEINHWLKDAPVGSIYINRSTRGAGVGSSPRGGWGEAAIGPGVRPGGPGFIPRLGRVTDTGEPEMLADIGPRVGAFLDLCASWLSPEQQQWLRQAARSDAHARDALRNPADAGPDGEVNLLRYRPGPRTTIRAGEGADLLDLLRLTCAALATGVDAGVSLAPGLFQRLPPRVQEQWQELRRPGVEDESGGAAAGGVPAGMDVANVGIGPVAGWRVETLEEFTIRSSTWAEPGRIRCLDTSEVPAVSEAVSTSIAVLEGPAVRSGIHELPTFLWEQSVSALRHPLAYEGKLEVT